MRGGRISALWIGLILAAVLLVALLIFIAQNSHTVVIHYLGFHGHISLGVAMLAAAVIGVLLVAIPGSARIIQLRRALKINQRGQS
ncbi:MAG: LapA family protein [Actinomycetota bacterium]|nr:LapA family protein [Actinomycetota bacterium]